MTSETESADPVEIADKKIEDQIKVAQRHLQQGAIAAALGTLEDILNQAPDNTDARYIQAVCYRYDDQPDAAFAALREIKRINPGFGKAFQEEGHLYLARNDSEAALGAYQMATRYNPALTASWTAQAKLLTAMGQAEAAQMAARQAEHLRQLPRELASVASFIHEGRLLKAERLCRHFLQQNPHHIEAMRLLADIGSRLNSLEEAEFLLESALEFAPDNIQVRIDYMRLLRKRQKFEAALKQARILYDKDPDSPVFQSNLAVESQMAGDMDTALRMFDAVLEKMPGDPVTLLSRGHALKTIGRHEEAVASYHAAYGAKPDYGDAFWSLANLKTYRFSDAEVDNMRRQEQRQDIAMEDRIHLCFALGKSLEDRGDYEQSFPYYERGNRLKKQQSKYRADHMTAEMQAQAAICDTTLFEHQSGQGHGARDPIFIVGLPRAGSTLIEQILASHSQIDGTLELPNILALSHRLRGRKRITETSRYPRILHDMTAGDLAEFGRKYIEDTRIHRGTAPYFTDKMPNNFRHIGLIHLILPNARIIDVRRGALSCCFSGFKQLFAEGQEFTYGLEEIGRYYRDYVALMDHWNAVLPGKILTVHYEAVVADLDSEVRRLLDYLELPFEEACVNFHQTKRPVRTASSEQVREKINTRGLDQWRHYAPWLGPLKTALGPCAED